MGGLERVFGTVLELGYASTWVILTVLLLRCALQRMPKKYSYLLWAIPAVRLLIPIPFAGIWGMLGGLPESSGGRLLAQVVDVLGSPSKLANLVAGKWAAEGMFGSMSRPMSTSAGIGSGGIWDQAVQIGNHAVSQVAEAAGALKGEMAGGAVGIPMAGESGSIGLAGGMSGAGLSGGAEGIGLSGATGSIGLPEGSDSIRLLRESNGIRLPGEANVTGFLRDMPVIANGNIQLTLMQAAAILWLVGVIVFVGWNVFSYIRLKRKLQVSIRWQGQVYFADDIRQPFVLPGFPCRIYLPSSLGAEGASNILRHERIHVRRKDPWLNLLAAVILGTYWFHPAVWAGVRCFRQDMEMSCDEAAVAGLDAEGVKAYVLDLLHFSVSHEKWMQFPCGFGEKGVMQRVRNLKKGKVRAKAALFAAGAVVVAAAVILIPNAWKDNVSGRESELADAGGRRQDLAAAGGRGSESADAGRTGQESADAGGTGQELAGTGQDLAAHGVSIEKRKIALEQEPGMEMVLPEDVKKSESVKDSDSVKESAGLQESLEQYFAEFYGVLADDTKNFSSKDFASIDSYMVWKRLQMRRYLGNALYGGIDKVRIPKVEIQSQEKTGSEIEAMVFVKALFDYHIYHGLPKKAKSQEDYDIYKVSAIQEENGYRILDFSCENEFYGRVRASLAEGNAQDTGDNYAAVDAFFEKQQVFQEYLERYFMAFYNVLLDDTKDFSHEDFASTNGYIMGKQLVFERYLAQASYEGVAAVKIEDVSVDDILETEDGIEVMAYVKISYSYGERPKYFTSVGDILRVLLVPEGEGYRVVDLDSNSEYPLMAKEGLQITLGTLDISQNYDAVDAYFEEKKQNVDSMEEWDEADFAEPVEE